MSDVAATTDSSGQKGFGIDIGGSGVKGGVVDLASGELLTDRIKYDTPQPSTPEAVAEVVAKIVDEAGWDGPVGITYPGVVRDGKILTAANVDQGWIGTDAAELFAKALGGRPVAVLNDADAAAIAEDRFGAAKDSQGTVLLLTFGTGIGSGLLRGGVLVPNTELGHLKIGKAEAEHMASSHAKDRDELSYPEWAKRVSVVLEELESLLWPDVFVVGGGISRKADKWVPLLTCRTPVVPAVLRNSAGIVGAAHAIAAGAQP
ncbi:MAG: polyphosphate--glucose phosphotransferase [Segniliparus sp.]|uniref:polyphosphate--glucose phosphotransferase n=1 Tax=Segniliparus sp. TaxID=2804064 RepID=UPI003F3A3286